MLKKSIYALYILTIVCMGLTTFIEKSHGTQFVKENIYGSWWFTLLWAMLAATAFLYFIKRRVRHIGTVMLHLSFVIILAGALLTHVTAERGMVHLREGRITGTYFVQNGDNIDERPLPFSIRFEGFDIKYHDGTTSVADYETRFTIIDNGQHCDGMVSMNNIHCHDGIRLYQSSYDEDMHGSILSLNADPWGIPVTYTGYALLFLTLVWMLIDPKGVFRTLLRNPQLKKSVLAIILFFAIQQTAVAAPVLSKETAAKFGELNILYNGRICPVLTFAIDFTKKLYGKASYNGYTAEQVLTGFLFYGDAWSHEPVMKIKNGPLRSRLQLPAYCSVNTFFNPDMGGYILGPYVREYSMGNTDKFHQNVADVDDRLMLIMELRRGTLLKLFPFTNGKSTTWHAPTEKLPSAIPTDQALFIANAFSLLYQDISTGNNDKAMKMIAKLKRYQEKHGGNSLPSTTQITAERIYNRIPFATILFMVNLTLGFVTLFVEIRRMTRDKTAMADEAGAPKESNSDFWGRICLTLMLLSLLALTLCEALRWIISGTIPMANGYETMLFLAWVVMILSLISCRRFRISLTFGFLMSGFFLLVSHIGQMDPNISHVMPVLNSPLLSIHVSIIMISFALLALTFICGVTALIIAGIAKANPARGAFSDDIASRLASLQLLSRLFLYPALTTLGIGIFIGAIWANVSWGQYWGWDPKEVWALITFMVYAIAAHTGTLPGLNRPLRYHIFMTAAFLTVLMTYFGVNYVLGGMHSYA